MAGALRVLIALVMLPAMAGADPVAPKPGQPATFGSAFLDVALPSGGEIRDAIGFRYACEVAANECSDPAMWKIVFLFHFLHGPDPAKTYEIQTNLYTNRFVYPHLSRRTRDGEVAGLRNLSGETGLFVSAPDNHRDQRVGARSRHPLLFPTLDQEIDGIRHFWKREQVAQENLSGKIIYVEIKRGEQIRVGEGWSVHGALPAVDYRVWTVTTRWSDTTAAVDFAFPDAHARTYAPQRMAQIATEAFAIHPGLFRVHYWDFAVLRESDAKWHPITRWKLTGTDARPEANTWGMRRTERHGRPAIEVSNDGAPTYLRKGDILDLAEPGKPAR